MEILKLAKKEPKKLINTRSEIYGGCRHKTKFHRYVTNGKISTDEGLSPEKSQALGNTTNCVTVSSPPPGDGSVCVEIVSNRCSGTAGADLASEGEPPLSSQP